MSLLMWAGERFAVVLGQVGTAGHLGCTDKPRVIARDAGLGDPELLWKTEPLVSLRHGVGCSQKAGECSGLQSGSWRVRAAVVSAQKYRCSVQFEFRTSNRESVCPKCDAPFVFYLATLPR